MTGALGEQYLREFQDNEKTIPTILTTSQKLSTGVDARNIRNIVLLRPINSMIEFKQIIGRGTRLFEGKEYFTIYDFVKAYEHFNDPEWDGPPEEDITEGKEKKPRGPKGPPGPVGPKPPPRKKLKIKLADGKEWDIDDMRATIYLGPDGKQPPPTPSLIRRGYIHPPSISPLPSTIQNFCQYNSKKIYLLVLMGSI
jgi:type I restriction enzyme R subunit